MVISISYYLLREKVKIQKIQNYIMVKILYIFLDFLYITYFGQTQGLPLQLISWILIPSFITIRYTLNAIWYSVSRIFLIYSSHITYYCISSYPLYANPRDTNLASDSWLLTSGFFFFHSILFFNIQIE